MSVRAIIFDLDGTLVDSTPDIADAVNERLADHGLGPLSEGVVAGLVGFGADELVRQAFAVTGRELGDAALRRETDAYLERYAAQPVRRSALLHDAAPALAALAARGTRMAVCTNKETGLGWTVLRGLGIDGPIEAVVGADAVPRRKPDPGHLVAALDAVEAGPRDALYVGDTEIDVRTAVAAGVACAIVAWGSVGTGDRSPCRSLARFGDLLGHIDDPGG